MFKKFSIIFISMLFFSLIFSSIIDFFKFMIFFVFIYSCGVGLLTFLFKKRDNSIAGIIKAIIIGLILNIFIFLMLAFFNLSVYFTFVILSLIGVIFLIKTRKYPHKKEQKFSTKQAMLILLLIFFSLLLISDRIRYVNDGIYVYDGMHPTYELSISDNVEHIPVMDSSYIGKVMKWHFGYPILVYQLVNILGIDPLNLVQIIFQSFILILIILYLFENYSKLIGSRNVLLCALFLFAPLSFSFGFIQRVINYFILRHLSFSPLSFPLYDPMFMLTKIVFMSSYALGILMLIILIDYKRVQSKENKGNIFLFETLLLTGLAMTRSTFFVPILLAYYSYEFLKFYYARDYKRLIYAFFSGVLGISYLLFFIFGAHQHNLWVLFPGEINIRYTTLTGIGLITNLFVSFFMSYIIHIGVGTIYIFYLLKNLYVGRLSWIKKNLDKVWIFFVLFFSIGMGLFLIDVSEFNNRQFLLVGLVVLTTSTYAYILKNREQNKHSNYSKQKKQNKQEKFNKLYTSNKFNKFNKLNKLNELNKLWVVLLVLLFLFGGAPHIFRQYVSLSQETINEPLSENNSLMVQLKTEILKHVSLKKPFPKKPCKISNDLINSLRVLRKQPSGNFIFNIFQHECGNLNQTFVILNNYFTRTGLSGKQTTVESFKRKGLLMQPDYCERINDNLLFYTTILNKNKYDYLKFLNNGARFDELSYYKYFKLFGDNFFTGRDNFFDCILKKKEDVNYDVVNMRKYLVKNKIKYVLFEKGDKPVAKYIDILNLKLIYDSETVKLYLFESA